MDLIAEGTLDRKAAIRDTPALIKAYLGWAASWAMAPSSTGPSTASTSAS
jgi:hypothetical protein